MFFVAPTYPCHALSRGTDNRNKQLNIYLSTEICKPIFLTIIFPYKFFQPVWILLTRRDQPATFLLSFS